MYSYHALINALRAHTIHINLNMILDSSTSLLSSRKKYIYFVSSRTTLNKYHNKNMIILKRLVQALTAKHTTKLQL